MKVTSDILLYQTEDRRTKLEVRLENETVWLPQEQMATLFGKAKSTINEHIKNVIAEGELDEKVVVRKFRITKDIKIYLIFHLLYLLEQLKVLKIVNLKTLKKSY